MKNKKVAALIVVFGTPLCLFADEPKKRAISQADPDIHVYAKPGVDTQVFEGADYVIQRYGQRYDGPIEGRIKEVPPPTLRDQIFVQAGFGRYDFNGWDHLKKDFLFIRARTRSIEDLAKMYPNLPRKKLNKLRALARIATW